MIHGAVAHPSASLSQGHIKLRSMSGHSAKVGVGREGSSDEGNHVGMWRVVSGSGGGGGGVLEEEGETNRKGDGDWGETFSLQRKNKTYSRCTKLLESALNSLVFVDLSFLR